MAGVNQVIMLSPSMVIISGMVEAGGLGAQVVASLNRINISLGFEAGLAVVILAIFRDRITASLGSTESTGYFGSIRRSRPAAAHRAAGQTGPRPTDPASFTDASASVQQCGFRRTHHESTPVTHSRWHERKTYEEPFLINFGARSSWYSGHRRLRRFG